MTDAMHADDDHFLWPLPARRTYSHARTFCRCAPTVPLAAAPATSTTPTQEKNSKHAPAQGGAGRAAKTG